MGPTDLLMTERLGAQVWVAPVGTNPNDADAWTPLSPAAQANGFVTAGPHSWGTSGLRPHVDKVDEIAANLAKAEAGRYYGCPGQRYVIGIDPASLNERSKPLGLTKNHKCTDHEGDYVEVDPLDGSEPEGTVAVIETGAEGTAAYVDAKSSIPLALNVLGWDRPDANAHSWSQTKVGEKTADLPIPMDSEERDHLNAVAIECLRAVDIYDQRVAQHKQLEEGAEARRKATYEASKKESLDRAKSTFEDALTAAALDGASAESAAKVQAALSVYETARRKFEGLPH